MPPNIALQIERQYNGVINCIKNSKSNPKSFETTINNLYKITRISSTDNYNFFKLALENNRPDLVSVLLQIKKNKINSYFGDSDSDDFEREQNIYNDIFSTICSRKSNYLNTFLNSKWIDQVDDLCIYEILIKKINYRLINRAYDLLTEYQKQDLFLNQNLKNSKEKIISHKKGFQILLKIEKKYKVNPLIINYWRSLNKEYNELKQKRINAAWTLIFFFSKYVKPGVHNWIWMPGGCKFKAAEKRWNEYNSNFIQK